jgi:preprotein translocase subunit SecG
MLYVVLTLVHIAVCIFLSLVVLLQSGKGQDLASSFGGGSSQTVFGSAGPATALSKATSVSAIIFMLTSLGLAILSTKSRSVMDSAPIPEAPAAVATPLPAERPGTSGAEAPATPAAQQPQGTTAQATPAAQQPQGTAPGSGAAPPAGTPQAAAPQQPPAQPVSEAPAQQPASGVPPPAGQPASEAPAAAATPAHQP